MALCNVVTYPIGGNTEYKVMGLLSTQSQFLDLSFVDSGRLLIPPVMKRILD